MPFVLLGPVGPTTIQVLSGVQAYASSGTFVVPAGVNYVLVEMWGGGGAANDQGNAGGGGGGYLRATVATLPGQSIPATVGKAGLGNAGSGSGGAGGASNFGAFLHAGPGGGGAIPFHAPPIGAPGAGGTVTGGVFSFPGSSGTLAGAGGASGSGLLYEGADEPTFGNGGPGGGQNGQPGFVIVRW